MNMNNGKIVDVFSGQKNIDNDRYIKSIYGKLPHFKFELDIYHTRGWNINDMMAHVNIEPDTGLSGSLSVEVSADMHTCFLSRFLRQMADEIDRTIEEVQKSQE